MTRLARLSRSLREPFQGVQPVLLVLFAVSAAFAILFFNQGDLFHTVTSSYAYLDGHILDFYDFNKGVVGGNDYLPGVYVLFALWMSPLAALGILSPEEWRHANLLNWYELLWAKILLLAVFVICFYLISAIAKYAFANVPDAQKTVRLAFLFSPVIGFAVFTFGQYDIFSVVFTLAGVLAYFKRKSFWFVFWFSIAVSFKYFALFLFIPLALFYFKKFWVLLLGLLGGFVFTGLEIASYLSNSAFRHHTLFGLAGGKVSDPLHDQLQIFLGLLFIVVCVLAYIHGRSHAELTKPLVYIWLAGYTIMFEAVVWHPQWTVILVPAFALAVGLMKRPGWFLLWESFAFVVFITVVELRWVANVDVSMIRLGPLSRFLHEPTLLLADILNPGLVPYLSVGVTFFFMSPLAWLAAERVGQLWTANLQPPRAAHWYVRVLVMPLVLTLPALALTAIPRDVALAISPSAVARWTQAVPSGEGAPGAFQGSQGLSLVQKFQAGSSHLRGVSIQAATFLRKNTGTLAVTVTDKQGLVLASHIWAAADLHSDQMLYLTLPADLESLGQSYDIGVRWSCVEREDCVGLWWYPESSKVSTTGQLTYNGVVSDHVLKFVSYYER